jgi:hypothetical protein
MNVVRFIETLRKAPKTEIFNPWWQTDKENDDYTNAPEIRRHQLKFYLTERLNRRPILLLGEAMGYQGGHFTGIAMTSERILLGKMKNRKIEPEHVFRTIEPCRTSKELIRKDGFSEPTATIVWSHLLELGIDPYDFLIWNAFPWHPYNAKKGLLSNRTPTANEFEKGLKSLKIFLELMNPRQVFAVGEKAAIQLKNFKVDYLKIRHPANGGAKKFRDQFAAAISSKN